MRFLRRRSNHAAVILLAIAMQAALAMGYAHTHAHGHMPGGIEAWAKSVVAMACRAVVPTKGCVPAVPHDDRIDCAACWSLATAGAGLLPVLAAPAVHAPKLEAPAPLRVAQALPDSGTVHFQARAPPRA